MVASISARAGSLSLSCGRPVGAGAILRFDHESASSRRPVAFDSARRVRGRGEHIFCGFTTDHGPASEVAPSCTLVANVRLFDGERVIEKTAVLVRDGKIAEVSPTPTTRCTATVDGAGKTLLPGLRRRAHACAQRCRPRLRAALRRDDRARHVRCATGESEAARPGTRAHRPIGLLLGRCWIYISRRPWHRIWTDGSDGRRSERRRGFVDACVNEGSDYIKIIYTPDSPRFRSMSRETLQASVEAAHRRHLLAVVHIATLRAGQEALEAGADGLAASLLGTPPRPRPSSRSPDRTRRSSFRP